MAAGHCRQRPGASPGDSACISTRGCAARSSHPCICSMGGKVGGGGHNSELPLPSSLCQLSSCPTDAPCRALVSTFPLQQVLGGQSPRPSAFAERVRDGRFPAMTKEWGGLVQTEVAGSRTSPGGRGVPCSPVFTRKRGGGVDGRGEISAAEMQPPLPSCIARITAAGTEPLRAPVGLFY